MKYNALTPYSTYLTVDENGVNVFSPVVFGKNQTTFNYKQIVSIQINSGILFSDVTLHTINRAVIFRFFKNEGKRFHEAVLPNLNK